MTAMQRMSAVGVPSSRRKDGIIYLAIGLRNLGTGIALLHGWHPMPDQAFEDLPHVPAEDFRRLTIDLYIPAGGTGYWEAAVPRAR